MNVIGMYMVGMFIFSISTDPTGKDGFPVFTPPVYKTLEECHREAPKASQEFRKLNPQFEAAAPWCLSERAHWIYKNENDLF